MAQRKTKLKLEIKEKDARGRPFIIEYDPVEGILWARPKRSQERRPIHVRGAWERSANEAYGIKAGRRTIGMTARI